MPDPKYRDGMARVPETAGSHAGAFATRLIAVCLSLLFFVCCDQFQPSHFSNP